MSEPTVNIGGAEQLTTLLADGIETIDIKNANFVVAFPVEKLIQSGSTELCVQIADSPEEIPEGFTRFICSGEDWCVGVGPGDIQLDAFVFNANARKKYFYLRNGVEEPIKLYKDQTGRVFGKIPSPGAGDNQIIVR